jgi:prepilin-type N-terminal cleavage/methylation domain-containing protein
MNPFARSRLRFSAGFSLLEVLVASAILGVVMMVLLSTLTTSLSLWRTTESKSLADREARASQLLLAQDLANVVMPAEPNLWPRIVTNRIGRDNVLYLKFLTTVPSDYQSGAADVGDVCYVEYAVLPSTNAPGSELRRLFWASSKAFSDVISSGSFPAVQAQDQFQSLGMHLLPTNRMAARGLGRLATEANNTNFILLGTNMLPFTGAPSPANYPAAIEVNFAVADPDTLRNTDQLNNPDYILRNAGLYSTRFYLPKPPNAP